MVKISGTKEQVELIVDVLKLYPGYELSFETYKNGEMSDNEFGVHGEGMDFLVVTENGK